VVTEWSPEHEVKRAATAPALRRVTDPVREGSLERVGRWIGRHGYARLPAMPNDQEAAMTGPDVLIAIAEEYRKTDEIDPAMADGFIEMLRDCFDASVTTTEAGRRVAKRPLDPAEHAAMAIVGVSIAYAKDQPDRERFSEVVRVGIALAIKFREYLDATGRR
jgi:hypothetical protein